MGSRWLPPAVVAGIMASVLAIAAPAQAENITININQGNVSTTAAAYSGHECSDNLGGGPYADQDVWVFNLPGSSDQTENFVSITATWSTPGGPVTKTIADDGGAVVRIGTSKAYITTDAGWTLTGATAVVSGSFDFFVLTHTCPASSTSPSASPTVPTSATPTPPTSATPTVPTSESATPGESQSPDPSRSVSVSASPSGGLPVTGTAIAGIVTTGVALLGLGFVLVLLYRRRSLTDTAQ
jgi:hypothetical protein